VNIDDAGVVIASMRAMWPNHSLDEPQVAVWARRLLDVDEGDAWEVLGMLERSSKFWPTWAEFIEAHQPVARRRIEDERTERRSISTGRPCTREENQAWLAHCRDILAQGRGPLAGGLARAITTGGTP